ncbi:hypothetical protein [Pseudobacter ginsenosidimutans]|uniref:Uncharacterized protein n=1 Tax=Pseudobacter ginsenosidimutans TaxID=661488 RepID=A0A4Q7N1S0_9BACT|nr:hypothetical protein [Pseudobacter ginsenosidimutans]QEC44130.1 hypothetical protein FSB84_21525 [Pseudobacter ginsenosidimutans]RZS75577.1 hypothetical protein EV199_1446 [Pseudobacter ginsenosidimutans]
MVTTDVAQLSRECDAWRETLRSNKASVSELDTRLQEMAGKQSTEEVLIEIDHYHNQFYIQKLNIHDLKHAIRSHQQQIDAEMKLHHGQVNDDTINDHERLYDNFQQLEHTLKDLKDDFAVFIDRNR